jgi:hypothetical protein
MVFAGLLVATTAGAPAQDPLKADASRMQNKLATIVQRGEKTPAKGARSAPVQRTTFTDREVNAYFRVHGPTFMPEGVADPQLAIDRGGKVRARAIVDLDAALKPKQRSWLDPLAWVGGKMEITAAGVLRAADGRGQFALETATLGGVSVPTSLVLELVSYYTRTPESPTGFALDKPFELPSGIRSVETTPGAATILQ